MKLWHWRIVAQKVVEGMTMQTQEMELKEAKILKCIECGKEYIFDSFSHRCPECGGALKVVVR